jgi:hypothetical protein
MFECRLDDSPWEACSSPFSAVAPPPPGDHVFSVRAIDPAGNVDATPATLDFAVAATPAPDATATPTVTPDPVPAVTPGRERDPATATPPAPAAVDVTGPRFARPPHRTLRAGSRGVVALSVGPADEDAVGTLRLRAAGHGWTIACALRRGAATTLRLALPRSARALLHRLGHVSVRATLSLADAAGNASAEAFRLTIRPAVS